MSPVDYIEKLGARARIRAKVAEKLARDHCNAGFVDSARRHALMHALDDNADALGFQDVLDAVGNLCRHRFLYLQAAGKRLNDACKLADANNVAEKLTEHDNIILKEY